MSRVDNSVKYERIKLDVKDKKILDLLSEDARIPVTKLSKKVEISRDVANYKLRRLEKLEVIDSFTIRPDFLALGYNTYHVFFVVDESKREYEFLEHIKNLPGTLKIFEYSDKWDYELVILAEDIRKLDKVITKVQAEYSDTIIERSELLEIHTYQSILFSYYFNQNLRKINVADEDLDSDSGVKCDRIDLEIMNLLSKDCRLSTYEIAREIDLSADAIGLRIKRLHKDGLIKKFSIQANLSKLGYKWHTFCIKMKHFDEKHEKKFRSFMQDNSHS